ALVVLAGETQQPLPDAAIELAALLDGRQRLRADRRRTRHERGQQDGGRDRQQSSHAIGHSCLAFGCGCRHAEEPATGPTAFGVFRTSALDMDQRGWRFEPEVSRKTPDNPATQKPDAERTESPR